MHTVVHMIASPRNISTAMMYSFSRRPGIRVIDEPFYACYLHRTGVMHPGFDAIVASQPEDPEEVISQLEKKAKKSDLFIKNMSHHMEGIALDFLMPHKVILLIRDPKLQIASFSKVFNQPTLRDIGIRAQTGIYDSLKDARKDVVVIDSGELLKDPELILTKMCAQLDIPFTAKMLNWKAGPIAEDGVWAKYWYLNVHQSTGFEERPIKKVSLDDELNKLYMEALPYYERLNKHALKAK